MGEVEIRELDLEGLRNYLKEVEEQKFYLEMKDRWSREDFDRADQLSVQIKTLRKMIKQKEEEQS